MNLFSSEEERRVSDAITQAERKTSGDLFEEESFEFPQINLQAKLGDITTRLSEIKPRISVRVNAAEVAREAQKELREQQKEVSMSEQCHAPSVDPHTALIN